MYTSPALALRRPLPLPGAQGNLYRDLVHHWAPIGVMATAASLALAAVCFAWQKPVNVAPSHHQVVPMERTGPVKHMKQLPAPGPWA